MPYPFYEITSSAMNLPSSRPSDESGPHQLDAMYAKENFGILSIDWDANTLDLSICDMNGKAVRFHSLDLSVLAVD